MKFLSRVNFLVLFFFLSLFFMGCSIENAGSNASKTILIASDFLDESDSLLFKSYNKKTGVKVVIQQMTSDELMDVAKKNGYNTNIDIVMMASVYDMYRLNKSELLQELPDDFYADSTLLLSSKEGNFVTYGVENYKVFVQNDSVASLNVYEDLITSYSVHGLTKSQLVPFLSGFYVGRNRIDGNQKVVEFVQNVPFSTKMDTMFYSLSLDPPTIDSSSQAKRSFVPAKNHVNLRTFGILNQSNDYKSSLEFVKYFTSNGENKALCEKLGILSMLKDTRQINYLPNRLMHHYFQVERILKSNQY